ncbi:hypothetical protein SAMN05444159_1256 [Bradyrhizobium lablabi]|uniref:Uncharacterized protein n=1 Tax=Bradyrhizobium lablabi TaxID=722472 RepID=A0A1M6LEP3_9BRAD|nr:hypothetical protein [Bradyrhizobium lablabi]SHJ69690.1 hypothetical protein SAMN05444159_1256 [Bradyrhizobium lablabi]
MSRRVVLGQQNDGSMGLRVSAPGVDALTAVDDGHNLTFNSAWTDIAKIYMVGVAANTSITVNGLTLPGFQVTWPALGYKPFVEARLLQSNVIYDDYLSATFPSGSYAEIRDATPNTLSLFGNMPGSSLLFVVYQIPVPSG